MPRRLQRAAGQHRSGATILGRGGASPGPSENQNSLYFLAAISSPDVRDGRRLERQASGTDAGCAHGSLPARRLGQLGRG